MDWPKITVIIVVRNAVSMLPRAIESVVAQAYPNLEFFVLDAASTDGTVEVIERYAHRITHWRSHADDGPNAAYNEGIARATGGIVALLNADDWYEPGILQAVGEAFAAQPDADLVTCEARVVRQAGEGFTETRRFTGKSQQCTPLGTPMPNARFFRRSLFQRYGDFQVLNHAGQRMIASDLEFLLRLSQHAPVNVILPRLGYTYLQHAGSITFAGDPRRDRQMYDERAAIAEHYLRAGTLKPWRKRLKRWHRRGTVRAFLRHWRAGAHGAAWREMNRGLRISPILWLPDMLRLAMRNHG